MITLLASIVGFISSVIPEIIKIFKEYKTQSYELKLLDKKLELDKINACSTNNSNIDIQYCVKSYELLTSLTRNHNCIPIFDKVNKHRNIYIDSFNATVRPILAYGFFVTYLIIKYIQYSTFNTYDMAITSLELLWSIDDQAMFASVISFYFGQRMFSSKYSESKHINK